MPQHSKCKQRPSMDNETLNTSATKVWSYQHYHQHPPSTTTTTISHHSSMSTATSTPECRSALPTWLQYHTTRQPDGVKCGFIGFSPRLNRALLMEATAYLCNFYHRSKPNVGFIVAFIQSAILLLSKADFVNGGHILSLCGWPIEIFVSNLKVQTKKGLSWWPSDFFVIAEEVNSFMIIQHHRWNVNICINHPLLFIFQSLRPSLRVGVFSNQAQLNRYHCSVDTKNLTHPPMQVILTIKIMAEHLFSGVFYQGISTNLSLCYFTAWFPIKWKFEIIYYHLETCECEFDIPWNEVSRQFKMEMSFKIVLRIVVLISNAYLYCSLFPHTLQMILNCYRLLQIRLNCLFEAHMKKTFIPPIACIN